jgi:hypothetical protein
MCGETVHPLRAMPERCLLAEPSIGVDKDGTVYLAWSGPGWDASRDVFVRALSNKLVPIGDPFGLPDPLVPERRPRSDQFLPSLAVDPQSGDVWVCFYDTTGDQTRQHATRTCAASRDHARTWQFVRAASVPSDQTGRRTDSFAYGDYEALVAGDGYAHPFWTDTRDRKTRGEEIYTTTLKPPHPQLVD